jgi:phosphatidylglycerol:prolipoprotein diacylglycerol transferase
MARQKAASEARRARRRTRQRSGSTIACGTGTQTSPSPGVEPEALVITHSFDAGENGEPYAATIRLAGTRIGIRGGPKPGDTFAQEDTIEGIVPGSGHVAVSSWVYGLQPGEWRVTADLVRQASGDRSRGRAQRFSTERLDQAKWSWRRWAVSPIPAGPLKTRWALPAPLARIPAVVPGSWPVLGTLGIVIALTTQAAILAREGVPIGPSLVASLLAVALGLVGAKLWYAVLHPGPWQQAILGGWAVDGFLAVSLAVGVVALFAFNLPVGAVLDATAPGLFFAVAIGRVGCFLTGCCAGRCTSSHWGVWSSDRRVGARRIPAQLLESVAGLFIGLAAVLLLLGGVPLVDGLGFVAAFGAYVLVRQLLLRLRAERREYSWRRSSLVARGRPWSARSRS